MDTHVLVSEVGMDPPGIKAVERRFAEAISNQSHFLGTISEHVLGVGGKRLRPALVLISSAFKQCDEKKLVDAAVAMELIHVASLVHDDIIDCSNKRHGCKTINARYGNLPAVLAGDYFFATAFNIMVINKQYKILELATNVIREMCEGEIEQALSRFDCFQTEELYMERIRKKTAGLLAACCQAGALICGLSKVQVLSMRDYGLKIGYAYQIIDDILDYTGGESLGKPIYADLNQGIFTLPILYLIRDRKRGKHWREVLQQKNIHETYKYEISKELADCGAIEYSYEFARKCLEEARNSLSVLPTSRAKKVLTHLTEVLYKRVY